MGFWLSRTLGAGKVNTVSIAAFIGDVEESFRRSKRADATGRALHPMSQRLFDASTASAS
jgi:hypothetical protein